MGKPSISGCSDGCPGLLQACSIHLHQRAPIQDAGSVHHAWQGAGPVATNGGSAIFIDVLYMESPELPEFRMSMDGFLFLTYF